MSDKVFAIYDPATKILKTYNDSVDAGTHDQAHVQDGIDIDQFLSVTETALRELPAATAETDPPATRLFRSAAQFLDLLLPPESSESAIANLAELYGRRLATNPGHAKRWLVAQVVRIIFGQAMAVLRTFSAARAGK